MDNIPWFSRKDILYSLAVCGSLSLLWLARRRPWSNESCDFGRSIAAGIPRRDGHMDNCEPGLLRKHSRRVSYTVPETGFTYPSIRVFYHSHKQLDRLPTFPSPIPLFVFLHGLGGSLAQFTPVLSSLVHTAPCLAIDLPGCGQSEFQPRDYAAYTPDALARLWATVINDHCNDKEGLKVILIGHSMGCLLGSTLASQASPLHDLLGSRIIGVIAICPPASPPSKQRSKVLKRLFSIPDVIFNPVFDLLRKWDRRGGPESPSVKRFVGDTADEETKRLQLGFNTESKTAVWRRMVMGLVADFSTKASRDGLIGHDLWASVRIPLLLIAGEADKVTPPSDAQKIAQSISLTNETSINTSDNCAVMPATEFNFIYSSPRYSSIDALADRRMTVRLSPVCEMVVLPAPASHALLYAPLTSRILSGLIQNFLSQHVDTRLSPGWQLQYLTTEGKWDVKNLAKWEKITSVSGPIAGVFRAIKTLRDADETHRAESFAQAWKNKISFVIDVSQDNPVYDPQKLEDRGIKYRKYPTVSKLPPAVEEVRGFVALIDELRYDLSKEHQQDGAAIAVHCHYGFNRTGFLIVCYLVERLHYPVRKAIEEFARQRPPGIKHDHFIDILHVRYYVNTN